MTEQTKKRAALHNLGCKVNAYETEAMQQMLQEAGYEIVPFSEEADVYVINTCTVTNTADKKSRQMIHRARKQNPDAVVVAAGCYVQTSAEQAARDPAVDIILGNDEKRSLIFVLEAYEREKTVRLLDINRPDEPYEELCVSHPAAHTRAFVKIQDGCDQFCSYCVIPLARGRARSRAQEQILSEVTHLAQNGYQEIVLTGIHVSSYGLDTGDSLLDLVRKVHGIEGVKRIRFSSLEPGIVTEEFVRELASLKKVCPHFHLSLQSGSDTVLRRMNRKYTTAEYLEKCALLRKYYEHPALTTDLIVGFPGETEEEFSETCAFVGQADFYAMHVFRYSRRDGTRAARMDGQIPEQIKASRSAALLALSDRQRASFESWYEGRKVEVLFEEPVVLGKETYYVGLTPEYVKVYFRSEESLRNRIMTVEFSQHIV